MKLSKMLIVLFVMSCLQTACTPRETTEPIDYSDKAELDRAKVLATKVFGLEIDEVSREGSERNYLAIRSNDLLFSQRLDSRTYFIQDTGYGHGQKAGVYRESDKELEKAGTELFRRLGIPLSQIAETAILQESSQVARAEAGKLSPEPPVKGRKLAQFSRNLDGIPVFSSKALLGLTQDREIGFLEFHWPDIPPGVLTEAKRLAYKVEQGWQPPEQKGARVESFEAAIVHSASTGFVMDIYPAIRVIYAPTDEQMGRKLVLYLDRHGNPVPQPREFDLPCEQPGQRTRSDQP